ncbi:D-alanyl-D-alanine carboxypeptidase family protein [Streptomyces paromomycinus]|uniref:D-alanyl-D-alanine carboxypeptidase n=1 Tax=Streptomyces paromomycinus TaxID=92743 RepID=A0A401VWA7_STREY|nr:serine hydrolase [Streptomyces paromomycinus]GCD41353.1 D-alanyl-D-alanine carboxypeptidase [Streptomyces paromomycinus]
MALQTLLSRNAGVLAVIAATGLTLTSIPAVARAEQVAVGRAVDPGAGAAKGQVADRLGDRTGRTVADAGAPALPDGVSARAWTVTDVRTGDVLAARNAHQRLAPASTLKTLFAVTVLPKFRAGAVHKVTPAELAGIGQGSSLVGIKEGRSYQVADLWRGVFLRSGNDAVRVLAAMNGGWTATAREMQARAGQLGARDTSVKSPDGYDSPGQVSSAYDLSVFGRAGLADADFARYCATTTARFPSKGSPSFEIQNTNRLLSGANGLRRYPGIVGVKNGYTSNAGNTLIAAARRGGRTLLVTVLNPQSGASNAVYHEAGSLLDWGFRAAGKARPVGSLVAAAPGGRATPSADGARSGAERPSASARPVAAQVSREPGRWSHTTGWAVAGGFAVALAVGAVFGWRMYVRGRRTPGGGS